MGWNDRMEDDGGKGEALAYIVESGYLDGAAEGIAKQVLAKGESSLSSKQQVVFEREVKDVYFSPTCRNCNRPVPLTEYARWDMDGNECYDCASRMAKG